jgi:gas vesicle protein
MENRRKEFRKARQAWQAAKEKAIQDLEMVKDSIRDYYLDDPEMFKLASSKLKQLDGIMDNLGDDLRDILDKYVSTPKSKQDVLQQLASQASDTVNQFLDYVGKDRLLNAVDSEEEMGLSNLKVREPLQKALKNLVKTLG